MSGAMTAKPPAAPAAVICGVGSWLPPNIVTNSDLAGRLDTTEEWIRSRTGVVNRRICDPGTLTSDIAAAAGARALRSAGADGADVVVLATTTPDRTCPATAPLVASRLALSGAAAFDIAAVCTGFVYGLAVAKGLLVSAGARRVLLIAADRFSTLLDPHDRTTVPIFGDGAGAVLLRQGSADESGAIGPVILGSDGHHSDLITVRRAVAAHDATDTRAGHFEMRGREVFRHAVERMSQASDAALAAAGWTVPDVDRLVAHQANARITAALANDLGVPADRCVQNIAEVGNTAAASIPMLLALAAADGRLESGHRVLVTAFGGGLTWGAASFVWPDLKPVNDD
jgi:3-oxoacyl-[acyl-carrier-protein] synthase-3